MDRLGERGLTRGERDGHRHRHPNSVQRTTGPQLLEWARRAEAAGFPTLGTIGRVAYPSYQELTLLAAAGAVTERIGLMSNILLAPTRSTAELAKQATTVHELSGGRLTLAWPPGTARRLRPHRRDFASRGRRFDEQLADLRRAFAGERWPTAARRSARRGAACADRDRRRVRAAVRRTVEFGDGYGRRRAPADGRAVRRRVRAAWRDAGREGSPRIVALNYFGLGDTDEQSRGYLLDYYGFLGPEYSEMIADGAHRSPEAIRDVIAAFAEVGVDELILDPSGVGDPAQVDCSPRPPALDGTPLLRRVASTRPSAAQEPGRRREHEQLGAMPRAHGGSGDAPGPTHHLGPVLHVLRSSQAVHSSRAATDETASARWSMPTRRLSTIRDLPARSRARGRAPVRRR